METSESRALFSKETWRGWLETLRQWGEAMDFDESELLERRIRHLEEQVAELRAQIGKP